MLAAALIWAHPSWRIADPLCTFFFSLLVLFTTTRLIKQSVGVLMEGVPEGIDPDDVEAALQKLPGVLGQEQQAHSQAYEHAPSTCPLLCFPSAYFRCEAKL